MCSLQWYVCGGGESRGGPENEEATAGKGRVAEDKRSLSSAFDCPLCPPLLHSHVALDNENAYPSPQASWLTVDHLIKESSGKVWPVTQALLGRGVEEDSGN